MKVLITMLTRSNEPHFVLFLIMFEVLKIIGKKSSYVTK